MYDAQLRKYSQITPNIQGYKSLMYAAAAGDVQAMNSLMNTNAIDINYCCSNGDNALILAARNNHHNAVALLINHDADINSTDQNGRSAIFYAIGNQNLNTFKFLVEKNDINLNLKDNRGNTPLIYAATKVLDLAKKGQLQQLYKQFFLPCISILIHYCKHDLSNREGKTAMQYLKKCIEVDEQAKLLDMVQKKTHALANCDLVINKIVNAVQSHSQLLGKTNLQSAAFSGNNQKPLNIKVINIQGITATFPNIESRFDRSLSL